MDLYVFSDRWEVWATGFRGVECTLREETGEDDEEEALERG